MQPPTFVAGYNSVYTTSGTSKTISITTQPGDVLVAYGGGDTNITTPLTLNTPTGNGVGFTLLQSIVLTSHSSAFIWSATDATGGTNWTLTCTVNNTSPRWGFSCAVFRNSGGSAASNKANLTGGAPSLGLTTTQDNSAIVVFNSDWAAVSGASRVWRTVNSVAPSAGNGLELTYVLNASVITFYGAYYDDAGTAGAKTVGLSAPGGQDYAIVAAEVLGTAAAPQIATVAWLGA